MDSEVNTFYEKINNKKEFIIFGLSYCGYTKKSKAYLKEKNLNYKFYNIDKYYNIFFKILEKINLKYPELLINLNHKTFPVIFYKNKFIGGYMDLINY